MSLWSNIKKFFGTEKPAPPPAPEFPRQPPPTGSARTARPGRGRDYWEDAVLSRKEEIWGDSGRYNSQRAIRNIQNGVGNEGPPPISLLKWAANASDDELEIAIRAGEEYSFLFYK